MTTHAGAGVTTGLPPVEQGDLVRMPRGSGLCYARVHKVTPGYVFARPVLSGSGKHYSAFQTVSRVPRRFTTVVARKGENYTATAGSPTKKNSYLIRASEGN